MLKSSRKYTHFNIFERSNKHFNIFDTAVSIDTAENEPSKVAPPPSVTTPQQVSVIPPLAEESDAPRRLQDPTAGFATSILRVQFVAFSPDGSKLCFF